MTETHRQISNREILGLVDHQVTETELNLSRLDRLEEDLHAARENIEKLRAENDRLQGNEEGLDKSKRMAKLRDNAAMVALEEGDLRKIQRSITSTRARTIALGHAAKSSASEILWALSSARRVNTRTALEQLLDFSQLGATGHNIELSARGILELKDLQYYFSNSGASVHPEYQVGLLRQLRQNFSELQICCEAEPNLVLPPITVSEPNETPLAEYEPAATSNQLGSLAEAVYK